MPRSAVTIDEPGLEPAPRTCADCGRTPLIGETLHHFAGGAAVCELCRPLRPARPLRSELVHHSAYTDTVRVHRRRAGRPPARNPRAGDPAGG